jgi:glucose-6-phosphate isomerase
MSIAPACQRYDPINGVIDCIQPSQRWLSQLKASYSDQAAYARQAAAGDTLIYQVSNVEAAEGDGQLHYGLGVLMPGRVGDEYYLTRGHIHAWRPAAEVYVCLSGQGMMLLEDAASGASSAIEMSPQQVIYVPGNTSHRTINTGDTPLGYWGVLSRQAGHDDSYVEEHGFRDVVVAVECRPVVMPREQYLKELASR